MMNLSKGFGLLAVMITTSILSIAMLAVTQIMVVQSKQMNVLYSKQSAKDIVTILSTLLENSFYCYYTFRLNVYSRGATSFLASIGTNEYKLTVGQSFSNLKILEISLDAKATTLGTTNITFFPGSVTTPIPVTRYLTNLNIRVSPLSDLLSKIQISKSIPIEILTDYTNQIVSCSTKYTNTYNPNFIKGAITGNCPNAVAAHNALSCTSLVYPEGGVIRSIGYTNINPGGTYQSGTENCNPHDGTRCKCCPNDGGPEMPFPSCGNNRCCFGWYKCRCNTVWDQCPVFSPCSSVLVPQIFCY